MSGPELSRPVKVSEIGVAPKPVSVKASVGERAALVARFGLLALDRLAGDLALRREAGGIRLSGTVEGVAVQACVVSGESVPAAVSAPVELLFSADAAPDTPDAEFELSEADCDVVAFDGQAVDVGEAVAQTFGLALDPFPRAEGAAVAAAREHLLSEEQAAAARSPFASLKKS